MTTTELSEKLSCMFCRSAHLDDERPCAGCIDLHITLNTWWQLQQLPRPCPAPTAQVHCKRDLASWHVAVTCHLGSNKQQLLRLELMLLLLQLLWLWLLLATAGLEVPIPHSSTCVCSSA